MNSYFFNMPSILKLPTNSTNLHIKMTSIQFLLMKINKMDTRSERRKVPRNREMVTERERKKKAFHTVNLLTLVELHFKSSGETVLGCITHKRKGQYNKMPYSRFLRHFKLQPDGSTDREHKIFIISGASHDSVKKYLFS